MKTITIIALIVGILAIGSVVTLAITGNVINTTETQSAESTCGSTASSCPFSGTESCGGGCTKESTCGSATCGAEKTGSCGCQN